MSKLENGAAASMNSNWLHEHDQALREQIAKEIEENCGFIQFCSFGDCTCATAAAIARGQK